MSDDSPAPLTCAIMIATRNRRADLARTCAVLEMLRPQPSEVLICADGCTDGTVEFLREFHPNFRLLIHEPARGSIASRDAMLRASTADLVLSLDDDSHPLEPDFLARAVPLFTANPRLAVVDFAQRSDERPASLRATDFGPAGPRASYSSAGAVLRRAVYLELGGYEPFFFHAYEEPDLALRCLAAGYEVRFEPGAIIRHHYTGTQRNELRTHQFHAGNELWSVFLRCPLPWLLPVAAFRVVRQFGYALSRGFPWALREPLWWWRCLRGLPACLRRRRPLPWKAYYAWMRLVRGSG
jgi:GT2 family glycosyltransferase